MVWRKEVELGRWGTRLEFSRDGTRPELGPQGLDAAEATNKASWWECGPPSKLNEGKGLLP